MDEDVIENYLNYTKMPQNWSGQRTVGAAGMIIAIYLMVVVKWLPSYMLRRKPFQMKSILLFYNTFQVIFSGYMVYIFGNYIWNFGLFPFRCPQNNPEMMGTVSHNILAFSIAKHLDLLDTVFFRLRKKDNQVSFLHLYHHSIMVLWGWLYLMYIPSDQLFVTGLLNSFVHVLMYGYYAISCLGPGYAKYVWWKIHLTKIQLIQFVLAITNLHYQQKWTPCPWPSFLHYFSIGTLFSFFCLFIHFYFKSYKIRKNLVNNQRDVNNDTKVSHLNSQKNGKNN